MKQRVYTTRWMAELDTDVCGRHSNANLTLMMTLAFVQRNPAGGAKNGHVNDYDDPSEAARKTVAWTDRAWERWTKQLMITAQQYWDGKFWLNNNFGLFEFSNGVAKYRPNIHCRVKLQRGIPGYAHHTIESVRLDPSETWFGSHATLYDDRDTRWDITRRDSRGKNVMQRAHVHEIGHLLGLGHIDEGKAHCPTGNTNAPACYGVADEDVHSVMGAGMSLSPQLATPWQRAIIHLTGKGSLLTSDWSASMQRLYPQRV